MYAVRGADRGLTVASLSVHLAAIQAAHRVWKRWSGYHRRSLVETAMSRFKRLGERLAAHDPAHQIAEVQIRCAILNTYNHLGMPNTVAIT